MMREALAVAFSTGRLRRFRDSALVIPEEALDWLEARAASVTDAELSVSPSAAAHGGGGLGAVGVTMHGRIGVIPVMGTIMRRPDRFDRLFFGAVGVDDIAAAVEAAMNDAAVRGVLLHVDSPGGEAAGTDDLADLLFSLRGRKPMAAIADPWMTSGAYYLGAQTDTVFSTRLGHTGSIGVIGVHFDRSEQLAGAGVRATIIKAGANKDDFSDLKPLAAEALERKQAEFNGIWAGFVNSVARARGLEPLAVAGFQARTYRGEDAKALGLVDRVGTFAEALEFLTAESATTTGVARRSGGVGVHTMTPEEQAAQERADKDAAERKAAEDRAAADAAKAEAERLEAERKAKVVDINTARDEGRATEQARTKELEELGVLTGAAPAEILGWIRDGKSAAEVRADVLAERAARSKQAPRQTPSGSDGPSDELNTDSFYERRRSCEAKERAAAFAGRQ